MVQLYQNFTADVFQHGKRLYIERGHNLVVTSGLNTLRDSLYGDYKPLAYFALGTNNTAASLGQTALVTEVHRGNITTKVKAAAKLTITYYLGSAIGNGNTIREAGAFNSWNEMYARYVLGTPLVKNSSITATFTWEFTFS